MDVTGLTYCMGPQSLRLMITSQNSSLLLKLKLSTQVVRMRRGRKGQLEDAEVLHVCIHEGIQQILWEK